MWGSSLPDKPITQEQCDAAFERACVKSEMKGNKLLQQKVEPRCCLECLKITWFLVTLEENGIGHLYKYGYCIDGKHDTITEQIKRPNWTDR